MSDKNDILKAIFDEGIIAVIRAPDSQGALKLAEAAIRGGINAIEITLTVPGALEVIGKLAADTSGKTIIGAGTVLDAETAKLAIQAGAEYVVSPHLNIEVVRTCQHHEKVCIPGAMSPKEVVEVMESGADAIKIFPAVLFGPQIIKEILGPLPKALMIPSTGVTPDNVGEWFEAGAAAVFVGGEMTAEALEQNDYNIVEHKAREYVKRIKEIKTA